MTRNLTVDNSYCIIYVGFKISGNMMFNNKYVKVRQHLFSPWTKREAYHPSFLLGACVSVVNI